MYPLLRPLLFRLDAEQAHSLTLSLLRWAGQNALVARTLRSLFVLDDPQQAVEVFGLRFANRVGLAAGYDKNGVAVRGLATLGFGHVEVGTVTRLAQVGNPKPRVHRVVAAQGVINAMGFPNAGVDALLRTLPIQHGIVPLGMKVGINIGKGKETPIEQAAEDYCALFQQVYTRADYVALNISSPNTLNLRQLQARAAVEDLLQAVTALRNRLAPRLPLLVKIAPDMTPAELDDVLAAIHSTGVDGIIATNTTVGRHGISPQFHALKGGLSGAPLGEQSTAVIAQIARQTGGKLPIIGVGGIMTPADAIAKLEAGATLVQLYTGLVYSGPGLVRGINQVLTNSNLRHGSLEAGIRLTVRHE